MIKNKVLLSAYACEPRKGSEPAVGWNWLLQMQKHCDVWVITRANNKTAIESFKNEIKENVRFIFVDYSDTVLKIKKKLPVWFYYYLWQIKAFFIAKNIHKQINFDFAHHVTFMSARVNFVPFLKVKSIVGPVGGLELLPHNFTTLVNKKLKEYIRELAIYKLKYSPLWHLFLKRTNKLILTNKQNLKFIPKKYHSKVYITQIGVSEKQLPKQNGNSVCKIYWGGILARWKGLEILLRSLVKVDVDWELDITGKGAELIYFKSLVKQLGLDSKVRFLGWIEKNEQERLLLNCNIFIFTSLRETTGLVLLEAMSYGKPVVALDWGGPSSIINGSNGIKIPVNTVEQTVNSLAENINKLANNTVLQKELGMGAYQSVKEKFCWDKKGEEMNQLYNQILNENTPRS
ncbi:MAG: glycosyltransferase [Calditrichaeota bacterium]|nr:MAG: glycosyltransferase [Calditrichota bacterium]MBL1204597.1 glycosyltransferase [Calditrichota bacterium]NOG44426.1 glycosyltransferase family 4 protein [Calditrichota bacterium]